MNIKMSNSKIQAFETMFSIMRGKYNTEELIELLRLSEASSISEDVLRGYLEGILDSGIYKLNTNQLDKPIVDLAGTGGDGKHTGNISTLAALICAATDLVKVAKYGNRAASGVCGSMDVLEALGIPIELEKTRVEGLLSRIGFAPLYAGAIYPGAKYVAEARKKIGRPTVFNFLFPLARPVEGDVRFVFGFSNEVDLLKAKSIYKQQRNVRCLLVHGLDGTDEISITGKGLTKYVFVDQGRVVEGILDCHKMFDITPIEISLLQVSSKAEAVELFKNALNPQLQTEQIVAIRNAALVNATLALFVGIDEHNLDLEKAQDYLPVVRKTLESGQVLRLVEKLKSTRRLT